MRGDRGRAPNVYVSGGFDDPVSRHVRFLQEAARLGPVHVLLWPDQALAAVAGRPPRFPLPERFYFLRSLRYVDRVSILGPSGLPDGLAAPGDAWALGSSFDLDAGSVDRAKRAWCERRGVRLLDIPAESLAGFPGDEGSTDPDPQAPASDPMVMATGSFDWLHTGHMRFSEEAAALGGLTVIVGHDANIRLLKGEGHPRFPQEERLFMVRAVRSVSRALLSTGSGWLDAEPEIERLRPLRYVVNEDGDKPEKRAYCENHGIEYIVLQRTPKPGLPRRSSTDLRGF